MSLKDQEISKLYYSIGEVANMFEVRTSLIRFWEKEFSIIRPKKNKKGNRLFTKKDIENLRLIYSLVKEKGFTLEGAKLQLLKGKVVKETTDNNQEICDKLKIIKKELLSIQQGL